MRGLAVLRAIGAAAAFENHLTGRVSRPALNTFRNSSTVTAADTKSAGATSETERTPRISTNERSRSDPRSPSPPALNLNKHRAGVSKGSGWTADRARSPGESSATEKRPLPPLAIVEKLLKVKGGSASLPLLKDDWSEGGRRRGGVERHTSADRKPDGSGGQSVQAQLGEKGIVLPEYGPGSYRILCPKCNGGSSAEAALSVTISNGTAVWCCHRATCGWTGRAGASRYVPSSSQGGAPSGSAQGNFVRPPKRPPKLPRPEDLLDLPPEMVDFFNGRGISEATLARNGVRMQVAFCPQKKESVPAVVFPYYWGGELVNAKYRTLDKQFWQIKGAEKVFYGIDDVIDSETVIIVEGEMDKLALEEAGYRNCVSVPDGAPAKVSSDPSAPTPFSDRKYSYVWTCQEDLSKASKFVLATDADGPGQALAEELARRLGREKCWRVNWPFMPDGRRVKDANEALMALGRAGVKAAVEGAEPVPAVQTSDPDPAVDGASHEQTRISGSGVDAGSGSRGEVPGSGVNDAGRNEMGKLFESTKRGSGSERPKETRPVLQASSKGPGGSQHFAGTAPRFGSAKGGSFSPGSVSTRAAALRAIPGPVETGTGLGWSSSHLKVRSLSTRSNGFVCSAVRGGQGEAAHSNGEAAGDEDVALDGKPVAPLVKRGALAIPRRRSAVVVGKGGGEQPLGSSESLHFAARNDEESESAERFTARVGVSSESERVVNWWEKEFPGVVSPGYLEPRQNPATGRRAFIPDAEARAIGGQNGGSADAPKVRKVRLRRTKSAPTLEGSGGNNLTASQAPLPSLFRTNAGVSTKQGEGLHKGADPGRGHVTSAGKQGSNGVVGDSAPVGIKRVAKTLPDGTDRTRAISTTAGSNTASESGAIAGSPASSDLTTERTQHGESESDGPPSSPAASGLNEEQLAAVFAPVGPVRVVAGPGSGKTKVLTNRVAHLVLDRGVKPWNTLVGTFHGICARILRKSVASMPDCGRTTTYVIYDETDSASLLRNILKKVPRFDPAKMSVKDLMDRLGKEKAWRLRREIDGRQQGDPSGRHVVPLKSALVSAGGEESPLGMDPILQSIAAQYEAELRKCNAFDFMDLLIWAVRLLRSCPSELQAYRELWQHLLVDEFQDTDFAQYELVRLLGEKNQSVFVVGDMDQSIYGWRGADFRNMQLLFERDFPGGHDYQLRKNYRSTKNILRAAEALIRQSEVDRTIGRHKPLQLTPTKPHGPVIKFLESATDDEEAAMVVSHVQLLVSARGHSWGDMAILYRTNSQARYSPWFGGSAPSSDHSLGSMAVLSAGNLTPLKRSFCFATSLDPFWGDVAVLDYTKVPPQNSRKFQQQLTARGIPFVVVGGLSFYARKEIKDIISYLKLIANPLDEVALNRVLNVPSRGIGEKSVEKLQLWAASLDMTLPQALHEYRKQLPDSLALTSRIKSAVQRFTLLMDHLSVMSQTESLDVLIREILQRTEYEAHIFTTKSEDMAEKRERWEHVQDLRQAAREHERKNGAGAAALASFLEDVALAAAVDEEGVEGGAKKAGKSAQAAQPVVKLMTIHAAKGLEFPCVFLVGVEEGLLPVNQSIPYPELVAEERRLCYVAITRARDRLFLSRADTRFINGKVLFQRASRFWTELA
ncbi:hypothetical protein KFL_000030250 [Klebsormidium nitens]|uniref:DNA 3'-5' helicase n=1 Tax=Klebsormidium nitens TaxID=105231 RepID=A0A1Y1HMB5_KLENI|nr:hypothetical protein KFL_000030250 [Klebsormidium nitens]|eukprot:GAQ77746.1 hypothetical protein KFL_000030250 [Klebsormidium nitens]